jgi:(p)ppGpp synthase/HD superfamily hydrolase
MPILTNRFTMALDYAAIIHACQVRKGTNNIPYLSHLLAVASLVLEQGGNEELAIAALLHDAAEDQGGEARLADIRARFGDRVADLVQMCSDSLCEDPNAKADWDGRKGDYLEHLRQSSDKDYWLVSCADKLHNARAILQDYREVGEDVWKRFAGKGKTTAKLIGYYDALAEVYMTIFLSSIAKELRKTVKALIKESHIDPDRRWERSL